MKVFELIRKITKLCVNQFSFTNLTTRAKLIIAFAVLAVIKIYLRYKAKIPSIPTISISQLLHPLNLRMLQKVHVYPNQIISLDKFSNVIKTNHSGMPAQALYNQLKNSGTKFQYIGYVMNGAHKTDYILLIFSLCSSLLIYYFYNRKDQTDKKSVRPQKNILFNDIVGLESAKSGLKEVLDFMLNPEKYSQRGARMRRGVLLYGPPGTGKTTLAKACANQAGIPFYSCNAAQFCQIYVGMGPKKVRQLFAKARETGPSVIFIDELDALGSRSNQNNIMMQSANSQKNSTINQILSELDGFQTSDKVLVIAATNRIQMVDKSLIRSGRFDLKIQVSLPNLQAKIKIFEKYLSRTKNNLSSQFLQKLLQRSQFCSGAEIQALVNQSIYQSIRRNSNTLQQQDILNAIRQQLN